MYQLRTEGPFTAEPRATSRYGPRCAGTEQGAQQALLVQPFADFVPLAVWLHDQNDNGGTAAGYSPRSEVRRIRAAGEALRRTRIVLDDSTMPLARSDSDAGAIRYCPGRSAVPLRAPASSARFSQGTSDQVIFGLLEEASRYRSSCDRTRRCCAVDATTAGESCDDFELHLWARENKTSTELHGGAHPAAATRPGLIASGGRYGTAGAPSRRHEETDARILDDRPRRLSHDPSATPSAAPLTRPEQPSPVDLRCSSVFVASSTPPARRFGDRRPAAFHHVADWPVALAGKK